MSNYNTVSDTDTGKYKFLLLDFLYLTITYIWIIGFPLSGDDYNIYQSFHKQYSDTLLHNLFLNPIVIRIFNILLCYLNMVLIYFITKKVTKGLWWLGSLSAVIFMAHPIMNLNITQPIPSTYLLTLAIGLSVVYINLENKGKKISHYLLSLICSIIAIFAYPYYALLILLTFILSPYESKSDETYFENMLKKIGDIFILSFSTLWVILNSDKFHFSPDIFPQTSMLVYPLGWLKESQDFYSSSPLIPFISSVGLLLLLFLIVWWVKNDTIKKLLISFVILLMFPIEPHIDLSQVIRNSHLVFPLAFGSITFAGICGEIQKLPRWNSPIIKGTFLLCFFMILFQFYLHFERGYGIYKEKLLISKVKNDTQNAKCDPVLIFPEEIRNRWFTFNLYGLIKASKEFNEYKFLPFVNIENYEDLDYSIETSLEENHILRITLKSSEINKLNIKSEKEEVNGFLNDFLVICKNQNELELRLVVGKLLKNGNICILIWNKHSVTLKQINLM